MSTAAAISADDHERLERRVESVRRRADERRHDERDQGARWVLDSEVAVRHVAARDPLAVGAVDGGVGDDRVALELRDEEADGEGSDRCGQREERSPRGHSGSGSAADSSPSGVGSESGSRTGPGSRRGSSSASRTKGRNHGM